MMGTAMHTALLQTALLLSLLTPAFAGAAPPPLPRSSLYPPKPAMPALPLKAVDWLTVNEVNLERTVAYGKCEEEGVREIFALLQTARYEEMWVFVPGTRPAECRWFEIGRDVQESAEGTTVRVDRTFLSELMLAHEELHLYHFHPLLYFERCPGTAGCGRLGLPRSANQVPTPALISNLRYAMPSPEDIYFMMDVSWEFKHRREGGGRMRHRVITPYGMVEYALTPEGQARYDYDRNQRTGGLYIALVAGNALLDEAITEIVAQHPKDVDAALHRLSQTLNNRHLRVTYTPAPANLK